MLQHLTNIYTCSDGTMIYIKDGNRAENDIKIYTKFPNQPWPHTLEYVAAVLNLKTYVEDNNYPHKKGFEASNMLHRFITDGMYDANIMEPQKAELTIKEICKKYKIKLNGDD